MRLFLLSLDTFKLIVLHPPPLPRKLHFFPPEKSQCRRVSFNQFRYFRLPILLPRARSCQTGKAAFTRSTPNVFVCLLQIVLIGLILTFSRRCLEKPFITQKSFISNHSRTSCCRPIARTQKIKLIR